MDKFTFKTVKPTGRWKSFDKDYHKIKLNGAVCGDILKENGKFFIRFMKIKEDIMSDGNANCPWKWVTLKASHATLQDAKDFIVANTSKILNQINLYTI
jgi:hypothetical protein